MVPESTEPSTVNLQARKARHKRLSKENPLFFKKRIKKFARSVVQTLIPRNVTSLLSKKGKYTQFLKNHFSSHDVACADLPCQERFSRKVIAAVTILFMIASIDVYYFDFSQAYAATSYTDLNLVADEEGYLHKSMPTGQRNYTNREEILVHKVEQGETVSGIAYMYSIRTATVLDNNSFLGAGNFLKPGQELTILPTDGFLYTIKSGDTLSKIAKNFKMEEDTITAHNEVEEDGLAKGDKLILAGVRSPQAARYIAASRSNPTRSGAIIGVEHVHQTPNLVGFVNPVPTNGRYSRGYTSWHPALDISRQNKSWSPNVVSAISGTVTKVRQYGWNGGYGSYLVVTRDDGVQVLMAHFAAGNIYVTEGSQVVAGQIVGQMGTTGRSTGVHLHIEVIVNGIKQNPLNYFSL